MKFFHTQLHLNVDDDLEDKLLPASCTTVGFNRNLEELTLEATSQNYSIPEESINRMGQLKVLTIKGNCDHPSKLHNLSSIASCLSNLTTLRFEHVSVPSLQPVFALRNLKQLSFVMCEIGDAFMSFTTESNYNMLPNLAHLEFDMCYDLKQLPSWICKLAHLQKLSITNCHELDALPKGLGGLSNLESLSLHCCTKLQELPDSIGSLRSLSYIDLSDCLSISVLPEEIGELCGLRMLKMNGCTGLQELPLSATELSQLEEVICDEETSYLWVDIESDVHNLKINVVEDDRLDTFMKIVLH
ncbi:putative leucine-rich repeat domain superfamily [Helianthus anomalus]